MSCPWIVGLAIGRPLHGLHNDQMSRKLISGQTPARELDDRGFVDGPSGLGRDDTNDAFAEALIRNTYDQRIPNAIMRLQRLFDFLSAA